MMRLWHGRFLQRAAVAPGLAASVVAHVVLLGAFIIASQRSAAEEMELPANSIARFLAPPNRVGGAPRAEAITWISLGTVRGTVVETAGVPVDEAVEQRIGMIQSGDVPPSPALRGLDSVFSLVEVDSAAYRYEWSAAPAYPPTLLEQGVSGFVRAEWVVDERGFADTATFRVISESHPAFGAAVREALPYMRFRPARRGTRSVSQLVEQPFNFRISAPEPDSTPTRQVP